MKKGSVSESKEFCNTLKFLVMFKNTAVSNFNVIDNNKSLTYDIKPHSVFKDFFSNSVHSF